MLQMVTIKEIAQETGLARTTVAEILRGKAGYGEASRKRVQDVARRLGYQPNYLSKALSGGPSMSIGSFWPLTGTTGDVDVAMAVLEEARERGYSVYHTDYQPRLKRASEALQQFAARRVDAVLFFWQGSEWLRGSVARQLNDFPAVVAVGSQPAPNFKGDLLLHDRLGAIEAVVDHLVAIGRRRLAIVLKDGASQRYKIDCFMQRCQSHGLSPDQARLIDLAAVPRGEGKHRDASASPATAAEPLPGIGMHDHRLLDQYRRAFEHHFKDGVDVDALFCGTDQGAMVAAHFLQEQGVRVPEDVAVVGWNNLPLDTLWRPPLASVDRSRKPLATAMSRMLFTRLADPSLAPRQEVIPMRFIWRESAGGQPRE